MIDNVLTDRLFLRIAEVCHLERSQLTLDTVTDDIGLDSMSLTQILATIESEFGIELGDDDIASLLEARCIGDYVRVLNSTHSR